MRGSGPTRACSRRVVGTTSQGGQLADDCHYYRTYGCGEDSKSTQGGSGARGALAFI
jgi:hypothetical protein